MSNAKINDFNYITELTFPSVELTNKYLSKKMAEYAESLPPSTSRAQAWNICRLLKNMNLNTETIAEVMLNDHRADHHALRHSHKLVAAGLATYEENEKKPHCYGKFTFIDGSTL